jgi:hypothetical protein
MNEEGHHYDPDQYANHRYRHRLAHGAPRNDMAFNRNSPVGFLAISQKAAVLRGSRFLRLPPESAWLLFLGLRLWGLSSRIIQNFSFRLQPVLFCIPAICSPDLIGGLTNTFHQILIHREHLAVIC